jgi:hypothetical protein
MRAVLDLRVNTAPPDFEPSPSLHALLERLHEGRMPDYLPPLEATTTDWRIELPDWCRDQRNQMTGPADDAERLAEARRLGEDMIARDQFDPV